MLVADRVLRASLVQPVAGVPNELGWPILGCVGFLANPKRYLQSMRDKVSRPRLLPIACLLASAAFQICLACL